MTTTNVDLDRDSIGRIDTTDQLTDVLAIPEPLGDHVVVISFAQRDRDGCGVIDEDREVVGVADLVLERDVAQPEREAGAPEAEVEAARRPVEARSVGPPAIDASTVLSGTRALPPSGVSRSMHRL